MVTKILQHDLLYYEKIIDPASYKVFHDRTANVKKPAWYSEKMSLDASFMNTARRKNVKDVNRLGAGWIGLGCTQRSLLWIQFCGVN